MQPIQTGEQHEIKAKTNNPKRREETHLSNQRLRIDVAAYITVDKNKVNNNKRQEESKEKIKWKRLINHK